MFEGLEIPDLDETEEKLNFYLLLLEKIYIENK